MLSPAFISCRRGRPGAGSVLNGPGGFPSTNQKAAEAPAPGRRVHTVSAPPAVACGAGWTVAPVGTAPETANAPHRGPRHLSEGVCDGRSDLFQRKWEQFCLKHTPYLGDFFYLEWKIILRTKSTQRNKQRKGAERETVKCSPSPAGHSCSPVSPPPSAPRARRSGPRRRLLARTSRAPCVCAKCSPHPRACAAPGVPGRSGAI